MNNTAANPANPAAAANLLLLIHAIGTIALATVTSLLQAVVIGCVLWTRQLLSPSVVYFSGVLMANFLACLGVVIATVLRVTVLRPVLSTPYFTRFQCALMPFNV